MHFSTVEVVNSAIAYSVSKNVIAHIAAEEAHPAALAELRSLCDNCVEDGAEREYWGKSEDGEWRVHVER